MLKKLIGRVVLYLDATGQFVHSPTHCLRKKRVLYYAGLIWLERKETVVPVLELITSEHDAFSIGN